MKKPFAVALALLVTLLNLRGLDEILLLLTAGVLGLFWSHRHLLRQKVSALMVLFPLLGFQALANPEGVAAGPSLSFSRIIFS